MLTFYFITGEYNTSFFFLIELAIISVTLNFDIKQIKSFNLILGISLYLLTILFVPAYLPINLGGGVNAIKITYEICVLIFYFVIVSFVSMLIFNSSLSKLLFTSIASYCFQNLIYSVASLIMETTNIINTAPFNIFIITEPISIAICFIVSVVAKSRLLQIGEIEMNDYSLWIILILVLISNAILGHLTEGIEKPYYQYVKCYSIILNFTIIYLQFSLLTKQSIQRKYYASTMLYQKEKQNYKIKKSSIEEMNQKAHDLKHLLNSIESIADKKDINSLKNSIYRYEAVVKTGSTPLDVVLADKYDYCNKHKINFTFLGNGKELSFIDEIDLYNLFVNLIDNAIDATLKIGNKDNRLINITLTRKDETILLLCQNYYETELKKDKDGNYKTTKENIESHGYGLKSINDIVRKYNGHITIDDKDNIFNVSILFIKP